MSDFKPGDVLTYVPSRQWCREGTALVLDTGRAVDTYWASDRHGLTPDELATAEVRFNVHDYDANVSREKWETYHPDDRGRVTSQHGHIETLYVRKGATPDLTTQITNARALVEEAEANLRSAEHRLRWRREDLAKLEVEAAASTRTEAPDA